MDDEKTLGEIAFEAYAKTTGGKTYDGKDIPPFRELPERIKLAWEKAANAVLLAWQKRGL